jgi:hypothetical protein
MTTATSHHRPEAQDRPENTMKFAEAYAAWRESQEATDKRDGGDADDAEWNALFDAERNAIWALIHIRAGSVAEIKQRAEVLVAECKSGPAADGRLVALALALVADLEAVANDRVRFAGVKP